MLLQDYKFTDEEKKLLEKQMVILVDSREKKNDHILGYFDTYHIKYKKQALSSGDYSFYVEANENLSIPRDIYFDNKIFIERKANLDELALNFSKNRTRFEEEFSISPADHKYLLIENANYEDILLHNYQSEFLPKSYLGSLHTFNHRYNLQIVFLPDRDYTPIYILGVFKYYLKHLVK